MEKIEELSDEELEERIRLLQSELRRRRPVKEKDKYEEFKRKVEQVLKEAGEPLTWAEIKEKAGFIQKVPNNNWVRQLEQDIGLVRERVEMRGRIYKDFGLESYQESIGESRFEEI